MYRGFGIFLLANFTLEISLKEKNKNNPETDIYLSDQFPKPIALEFCPESLLSGAFSCQRASGGGKH